MSYSITVKIAAAGSPLSDGTKSAAGHMWYTLTGENGESHDFGWGPIEHQWDGPGYVSDNDSQRYDQISHEFMFDISREQFDRVLVWSKIQKYERAFGPYGDYNLVWNSCVDLTWEAMRQIRIADSGPVPLVPMMNVPFVFDEFYRHYERDEYNREGKRAAPPSIWDQVSQWWRHGRVAPRRDPLAIDLDRDGIETVGVRLEGQTLHFDHDADGIKTGTGWLKGDDAWLAMDRNGNGAIDSGRELFGVDTVIQRRSFDGRLVDTFATNGFQALAALDAYESGGVTDGRFDTQDAAFGQVRLWRDLNSDGVSQAGELSSLASAGITSIDLSYAEGTVDLGNGNRTTGSATVTRAGGDDLAIVGLDLVAANPELADNTFYREFSDRVPYSADAVSLPDMGGSGWLRDLREAMSLGTPAASDLVARVRDFAATPTRAGQSAGLDAVIDAWARTTGRVNEAINMGHVGDSMKYDLVGKTGLP